MDKGLKIFCTIIFSLIITNRTVAASSRDESLLVLGDSLTAGYGVRPEERFTSLLPELAKRDGISLTVFNAGLSGDTSAGGKRRIESLLDKNFSIFMLALGANDSLRALPIPAMKENLRAILRRVQETRPQALLVIAGMQAPPNLGMPYGEQYQNAFKDVASEFNAVLIPFLLDGVAAEPLLNLNDGIHPNPAGHKIIAELVWKNIFPKLARQSVQ